MLKIKLPRYGIADLYCTYIPKYQLSKGKSIEKLFGKNISCEDSHKNLITVFSIKTNFGYIPVKNIKSYRSLFNPLKYCEPVKVIGYSSIKDKTNVSDKVITSLEAKLGDKWQRYKR